MHFILLCYFCFYLLLWPFFFSYRNFRRIKWLPKFFLKTKVLGYTRCKRLPPSTYTRFGTNCTYVGLSIQTCCVFPSFCWGSNNGVSDYRFCNVTCENASNELGALNSRFHGLQLLFCDIIVEGFRFMPLGLVRLRTFRLSTWVS